MLYRYNSMFMDRQFAEFELHHGQVIFLAQLFTQDGMTQEDLTSLLSFDKATTAKAMKNLELLGYIERLPDDVDKRCKRIKLTFKARLIEQRFFEVLDRFEALATSGMTIGEIKLLAKLMKRMTRNVSALGR